MVVRRATPSDIDYLVNYDSHISNEIIYKKIETGEVLVAYDGDCFVGFLRFGWFWDEIPFMNLLFVIEAYRSKGVGRALVKYWESLFKGQVKFVLTSTLSDESAQHFYRKLGYEDIGGFNLPGEATELVLMKEIQEHE
jgi:ribosomal protein S18 acetylase RimI-like enzyme